MSRSLTSALCALLGTTASLAAQRTTEQFIPIGRSPGVSGTNYAVLGTIESVNLAAKTLRIAGPQGAVTLSFTDTTRIYVDRSAQAQSALVGSPADLVVGRRVEAKFVSYERRTVAEWIKVADQVDQPDHAFTPRSNPPGKVVDPVAPHVPAMPRPAIQNR